MATVASQKRHGSTWLGSRGLHLALLAALLASCIGVDGRRLVAKVKATAVSTGGIAIAKSKGSGNATIDTLALAERNGTAVAEKDCHNCNATVVTVSVANDTTTLDSTSPTTTANEPATQGTAAQTSASPAANTSASPTANTSGGWTGAPACKSPPTQLTAVQDQDFRLWGYQDNAPCAYKTADQSPIYYPDYKKVTAEEAPRCKGSPSHDAKADSDGRKWGWQNNTSCIYVDPAAPTATATASSNAGAATSLAAVNTNATANAPVGAKATTGEVKFTAERKLGQY